MTRGEKIRTARVASGMTQEELGAAIGTTKQTIFKYESEIVTNIPIDKIESISRVLDISPAYLMGWSDDPNDALFGLIKGGACMFDIGSTIKNRRIDLGLTQHDVARAVGVSEATVSRWESGEISNMRRSRMASLAKILQISPSALIEWEDTAENPTAGGGEVTEAQKRAIDLVLQMTDAQLDVFIRLAEEFLNR